MRASTSVVFTPGHWCCTLTEALNLYQPSHAWYIDLQKIFEHTHLNFTVSGWSKHRYIHTRVRCSHASVGLAQAHLNYHGLTVCENGGGRADSITSI